MRGTNTNSLFDNEIQQITAHHTMIQLLTYSIF